MIDMITTALDVGIMTGIVMSLSVLRYAGMDHAAARTVDPSSNRCIDHATLTLSGL